MGLAHRRGERVCVDRELGKRSTFGPALRGGPDALMACAPVDLFVRR